MAKPQLRAVGILTEGGPCPGINAVIAATTRTALDCDWEIFGIEDGWDGILRKKARRLTWTDVHGIAAQGGSILGTTQALNPFEYPTRRRHTQVEEDRSAELIRNFHGLGLAGLIVVGSATALAVAERLHRKGIPLVGVPAAIDDDISGTATTFGPSTAVETATQALDRLHPTRGGAGPVFVVEVLGRTTGWVALYTGLASAADVILIPEIPFRIDKAAESIRGSERKGRELAIVVVAEGGWPVKGLPQKDVSPEAVPVAIGGWVADELALALKKPARLLALGDLQRGGAPSVSDRVLAARFGHAAMRLVNEGRFGNMVTLKPPVMSAVPLHQVVGKMHRVPQDSDVVLAARDMGSGFGD